MKYLTKAERVVCLRKTRKSWADMFVRCVGGNSKCVAWKFYGGIGVRVCARWSGEHGFENFVADLGLRPEGKTIGRRLDTGNYEPGNAWWQTNAEQVLEKRRKNLRKKYGANSAPQARLCRKRRRHHDNASNRTAIF